MALNNSNATVNPNKIFVFDLDQTLIEGHTGGVYNRNPIISNTSLLVNLKSVLTQIKNNGNKLFLNSRGNYDSCIMVLKDIGFIDLFKNDNGTVNVYAANIPSTSFGYKIMEEYIHSEPSIPNGSVPSIQISDGGPKWAEYKTYFLSALVKYYDIQQDNIVFFDDTIPNVEKSKSTGFKNSYTVNVPLNNLISLLIPFLCEPCKTCPPCQEYKYKFGDATKAATKVVSDKAQTTAKVVTNTVGNVASGLRGFFGRGGKKTIKRNKKKHSKKINRKPRKTIKRKNKISNKTNNKK